LQLLYNFTGPFPGPGFTATGQLTVNDVRFDLVGQGFTGPGQDTGGVPGLFSISFSFPEPSTLVLLSIGILILPLLRLLPNSKLQRLKKKTAA